MWKRVCGIGWLGGALLVALGSARAQGVYTVNVMADGVCAEYFTNPVVGDIGTIRGTTNGGEFGHNIGKGFIAHWAVLSTEAATVTLPKGILTRNYFQPGRTTFSNQPTVFSPGRSPVYKFSDAYLSINYALGGAAFPGVANQATVSPIGVNDSSGNPIPPSRTCEPEFLPSTALNLRQPGTYTHQYLGQVDSGPGAGSNVTFTIITLSSHPNVTVSNATYVPNDGANPSGSQNPNSIYADIAIDAPIAGNVSVEFQLAVNGVAVVSGLVPIAQ